MCLIALKPELFFWVATAETGTSITLPELFLKIICVIKSHAEYSSTDQKFDQIFLTDKDNQKIDQSINNVTRKQIKQLVKWQKNHPDYENNDKLLEEYFKLTRQVMGGGDITEMKQNEVDIKKSLGNELEIKDAMIKN